MSFLPIREENEEAPAGQTTNIPGGAPPPPQTSGSAGGAPEAPKGASAGSPTQFGSSASKLGSYLEANAPQINQQAETMAGNLNQQYGQTYGNVGQAINQFGGQVKSGYTGFDQGSVDAAIQNALRGQVGDSDIQAIQSRLQNQYQGPLSFEQTDPYSQVQADVSRASQNAQLLTTEPGVRSYFQSNYGQEAPGMATLDTALLTSAPEAFGKVQQAAAPFAGLGNYLSQQTAQANTAVPAAQQEIERGKQYAGEKLSTAEQNIQNQIAEALSQRQTSAQSQNQSILQGLKGRTISDQDLAALGVTRDQWNALNNAVTYAATPHEFHNRNAGATSGTTDIDLTQFLQQQNPNALITAAGVATPEQLAQTQALQKLSAGQWSGNPLAGVEKVGDAPTGLSAFDYQNALGQAQGVGNAQAQAAQAYVDALQAGMDEEHAQARAKEITKSAQISGTVFPLIPLSVGAGAGIYDAGKTYYNRLSSSNPAQIAANVASFGMIPVGQAIASGVSKAIKTVGKIFCFEGQTKVEMADGTTKEIKAVVLGDLTRGGEVVGLLQAYTNDLYDYAGVAVSGKHAVNENGKWVRVEDSEREKTKTSGEFTVYCLITSGHRIFVNGIEFADYVETNQYEQLSIDESLDQLNAA